MPKKRDFTPISSIEQDLQAQTQELYKNTEPAMPNPYALGAGATQIVNSLIATAAQVSQQPKKAGRKKDFCIIKRENGKLLFLEDSHNASIEEIHWQCKADRQDIIRTAIDYFIKKFYVNGHITPEGEQLIKNYYEYTHTPE